MLLEVWRQLHLYIALLSFLPAHWSLKHGRIQLFYTRISTSPSQNDLNDIGVVSVQRCCLARVGILVMHITWPKCRLIFMNLNSLPGKTVFISKQITGVAMFARIRNRNAASEHIRNSALFGTEFCFILANPSRESTNKCQYHHNKTKQKRHAWDLGFYFHKVIIGWKKPNKMSGDHAWLIENMLYTHISAININNININTTMMSGNSPYAKHKTVSQQYHHYNGNPYTWKDGFLLKPALADQCWDSESRELYTQFCCTVWLWGYYRVYVELFDMFTHIFQGWTDTMQVNTGDIGTIKEKIDPLILLA